MSRINQAGGRSVNTSAIEALAERVRGPVLTAQDEQYDAERAGNQTARWHLPDVVVGATGPADVQAAVQFAGRGGLPVAVQGTGHALAAVAAEGGVLITTSRMLGVRVNAAAKTAWVGAGVRWDQVIHEAAASGLAPLSGSAPGIGVVSYTLAGGLGLLSRRYGYAADHVRSLDVVTADGQLRVVTKDVNSDLFWALRGGRDNFGVVTGMEFDLMPVTTIYGGGLFFAAESIAKVFDAYVRWTATVPDEMSSSIALISFPDVTALPPPLRGRYVAHIRIAYSPADDLTPGAGMVAPLRELGPFIDTVQELPYTQAGSIHNDPTFAGAFESGTATLRDFDSVAVRALLELAGPHAPVPHVVELRHLGGRLTQPAVVDSAVGNRDARFLINVISRLERAEITEIRPAHERIFAALAPWTTGRALNFMNGERDAEHVRSAYSAKDYKRLAEIKAAYDPSNLFRLNHNIPPAGSEPLIRGTPAGR